MKEKWKIIAGVFMALVGIVVFVANIFEQNIAMIISGLGIAFAGVCYLISRKK